MTRRTSTPLVIHKNRNLGYPRWWMGRPRTLALINVWEGSNLIGTRRGIRFNDADVNATDNPSEDLVEIDILAGGGGGGAHSILDSTNHTDSNTDTVSRGSLITGQGATPKWDELVLGASGHVLTSDGMDVAWAAPAEAAAAAHVADASDAHDASAISILDTGAYFTGTDVEAALQELGAGGGGGGVTDHGALTGLTDDDHSQYPLLLGRAGGQTILGGTGSGDDLTLGSTGHSTKGDVIVQAGSRLNVPGPTAPDIGAAVIGDVGASSGTFLNIGNAAATLRTADWTGLSAAVSYKAGQDNLTAVGIGGNAYMSFSSDMGGARTFESLYGLFFSINSSMIGATNSARFTTYRAASVGLAFPTPPTAATGTIIDEATGYYGNLGAANDTDLTITDAAVFRAGSGAPARAAAMYGFKSEITSTSPTATRPFYDAGVSSTADTDGNRFASNTQLGSINGSFGTGYPVLGIANAVTVPSTNPTGGGVMYAEAGLLKWRRSDGTIDVLGAGGSAHTLLGTTHTDAATQTVNRGSLIVGNATPAWDELTIGAAGYVLTSDGTDATWQAPVTGVTDHGLLSGLADDDHPQYRLESADHDHTATGLQAGQLTVAALSDAPAGELGGTWAAPTVDATHSGSTHSAAADAHVADAADAHDASAISILDTAADFTATDVEGALAELQTRAEAHLADTADAHDASAISILDTAGDFTATDVEAALAELQSDNEAHTAAADPHTGYRLESADHTHQSTGLQGGLLTSAALSGTPGGELGGTWAAPTVDATHSGSAHVTAHSGLSGLTNDEHVAYARLTGRSGGQTFQGGTAASNNLTLESTAHATKGYVRSPDNFALGAATPSFGGGVGGCVFIANRTTAPSTNPVGGGVLYAQIGALVWRGSSGTVTTIAIA